jgi:hypothetical protein
MVTETKPTVNQGDLDLFYLEKILILSVFLGSSGLLLLAAAAEQKRKDEKGKRIFFIQMNKI